MKAPEPPSLPSPESRLAVLVLVSAAGAALLIGWKTFWFLTDDAFIAFRYASNHRLGFGYVWNPPPFAPVEGYTSFAWIVLLEAVWRWFGVVPPRAANPISLALSFGSLILTVALLRRALPATWTGASRLAVLAVFLAFLVANRTFLAWSSSGLETALFQFLVLLWVRAHCIASTRLRIVSASFAASALALTRPDGLLFCAATALSSFLAPRSGTRARTFASSLLEILPLAAALIHLLWRRSRYGEWLPNTYAAKFLGAWPESGARYAFCFVIEYALWIPGVLVAIAVLRSLSRKERWNVSITIAAAALLAHAAYYTFVIGGDHFEYRVYVHLLPLVCVASAWAFARFALPPRRAMAIALVFLVASLPIPWTHWQLSRKLNSRPETHVMTVPVAPSFPPPFSLLLRPFDEAQAWLIERHVCMRHQEHLVFCRKALRNCPSREEGSRIPADGLPVLAIGNVGVPSWMFPHVNVLDLAGLNDRVIARTPVRRDGIRKMAHDRSPPAGYVESFRPNFEFESAIFPPEKGAVLYEIGRFRVIERRIPLTEGEVRAQEALWQEHIASIRRIVERTGKVY